MTSKPSNSIRGTLLVCSAFAAISAAQPVHSAEELLRGGVKVRSAIANELAHEFEKSGFKWGARPESSVRALPTVAKLSDTRAWGKQRVSSMDDDRRSTIDSTYAWSTKSSESQAGFKWGLRSTSDQSGFKWGLRSTSDQSGFKWGLR
jgi:hypothetical protein